MQEDDLQDIAELCLCYASSIFVDSVGLYSICKVNDAVLTEWCVTSPNRLNIVVSWTRIGLKSWKVCQGALHSIQAAPWLGWLLINRFFTRCWKGLSKVSEQRCTLLLLMCLYPNSGTRIPPCVTLTLNQLRDCRFAAESPAPLFLFSLQFMAHGCCFLLVSTFIVWRLSEATKFSLWCFSRF